jgi:hypothetical protein
MCDDRKAMRGLGKQDLQFSTYQMLGNFSIAMQYFDITSRKSLYLFGRLSADPSLIDRYGAFDLLR